MKVKNTSLLSSPFYILKEFLKLLICGIRYYENKNKFSHATIDPTSRISGKCEIGEKTIIFSNNSGFIYRFIFIYSIWLYSTKH